MAAAPAPGANVLLRRALLVGGAAATGATLGVVYVARVKLLEYLVWRSQHLRLRIGSVARNEQRGYSVRDVRIMAPPPRTGRASASGPTAGGERAAYIVERVDTNVNVGAALAQYMPWNRRREPLPLHVTLHEPRIVLEFDNYELTDSNWRAIAREMHSAPGRVRRRAEIAAATSSAAASSSSSSSTDRARRPPPKQIGAGRILLDAVAVQGDAHMRVQSHAVGQVFIDDAKLSGGEVRVLELMRSPETARSELERMGAKRLLTTQLPSNVRQDTRRMVENYAKTVVSLTTEELRARGKQGIKKLDTLLDSAGRALDEANLPKEHADRYRSMRERAKGGLGKVDKFMGAFDRPSGGGGGGGGGSSESGTDAPHNGPRD